MADQGIGAQEAIEGELRLELAARLPEIARMVEAVESFADSHGWPPDVTYQVTVVLDELVTNAVSYGIAPGETRPIVLRIRQADGVLEIVLSDPGQPFDPRTAPEPDTEASLEDRKIGGLGIHIARSFMDRLDYRYDGHNHLTLVKRLGGTAP